MVPDTSTCWTRSRSKEKVHSRTKCQEALTPKHTAAESTPGVHQPDLWSLFFDDEVSFFILFLIFYFLFDFFRIFSATDTRRNRNSTRRRRTKRDRNGRRQKQEQITGGASENNRECNHELPISTNTAK